MQFRARRPTILSWQKGRSKTARDLTCVPLRRPSSVFDRRVGRCKADFAAAHPTFCTIRLAEGARGVRLEAEARVALVIYSDFECPFCARFANDTWPALDGKYVATGKVRTVFRHLPLEKIHSSAVKAAEATECAGQQGQFWPMHDVLFKNTKELGEASLFSYAQQIRLDVPAFQSCLKGMTTAKVRADAAAASALGITGTPAFLLGTIQPDGRVKVTERIAGARPLAAFETAIDKVLATSLSGTK